MTSVVDIAFEPDVASIPIADILPTKPVSKLIKGNQKYRQIAASIKEVGVIEPPVVARMKSKQQPFLLLDGHLRVEVLKDLGEVQVTCLVALDDEGFTYNKRVNRLSTIQEHKMILKAIDRGVSEQRLAKALNVNVENIRAKYRLLDGICPEAAELLKDRHCPQKTFQVLKKMKPVRQIEATELMIATNNMTVNYANALLAATAEDQLASATKRNVAKGLTAVQVARMEKEMGHLQREVKSIEGTYGINHLNLVFMRGYLSTLIGNERVASYLDANFSEFLDEFREICDSTPAVANKQ